MTKEEFKEKIKILIKTVRTEKSKESVKEKYILLIKFPELKEIIIDLLTDQYNLFLSDIQYVAPRPTTFRIVLQNGYSFYLIYAKRSWVAEIEGKSYYLLNLGEEEAAAEAIARILRYKKSEVGEGAEGGGEEGFEEEETTEEETEETEEPEEAA